LEELSSLNPEHTAAILEAGVGEVADDLVCMWEPMELSWQIIRDGRTELGDTSAEEQKCLCDGVETREEPGLPTCVAVVFLETGNLGDWGMGPGILSFDVLDEMLGLSSRLGTAQLPKSRREVDSQTPKFYASDLHTYPLDPKTV
jgi:hypothetical protein